MPGSRYTAQEYVILMYFISRGMFFDVISDVIHKIIGTNRTETALAHTSWRIRLKELETSPFDLFDNDSNLWNLELVDYWLVHQLPLHEVQRLIHIDQELLEIIARVALSILIHPSH